MNPDDITLTKDDRLRQLRSLAGFETEEKEIHPASGERLSVTFDLQPLKGAAGGEPAPAPAVDFDNGSMGVGEVDPMAARAVVLDGDAMDRPVAMEKKKRFSPLIITGIAGTVAAAGVSGAMWGIAFGKLGDYREKNSQLKNDGWTQPVFDAAKTDRADAEKFNNAAIAMTAVTVGFVGLLVSGLVLRNRTEKPLSPVLSWGPAGIQGRF